MTQKIFIPPRLIAHRGASMLAPENTLASLRACSGVIDWVEFDVMLSRDLQPVVFHDNKINRITTQRGYLSDLSYKDIKKLDVGSWYSPQFKYEKVPHLIEWLETASDLGLSLNIELKCSRRLKCCAEMSSIILSCLERFSFYKKNNILLSTKCKCCLHHLNQSKGEFPIGYIVSNYSFFTLSLLRRHLVDTLHVNEKILNPWVLNLTTFYQVPVIAYTVNNLDRAYKLRKMGVCGIFSDDVMLMRKIKDQW